MCTQGVVLSPRMGLSEHEPFLRALEHKNATEAG